MYINRKTGRAYVGINVPYRERADGTRLVGTRKFTYDELVRYKRENYGNRYFQRIGISGNKKLTAKERHDRAMKALDTKLALYGEQGLKEIARKGIETKRKNPQAMEELRARGYKGGCLCTPEANAKKRKWWDENRGNFTKVYTWINWYFIAETDIDGFHFDYLEPIRTNHPVWDKAHEMRVIFPRNWLEQEEQSKVKHMLYSYWNCIARNRKWISRRPDIIVYVTEGDNIEL